MVNCTVEQIPFCCGVVEVGEFGAWTADIGDGQVFDAETHLELLQKITNAHPVGIVMQAWFVRRRDWEDVLSPVYEYDAFRDLVRALPNVVPLGTTINPNSSNEIDGYLWINERNTNA